MLQFLYSLFPQSSPFSLSVPSLYYLRFTHYFLFSPLSQGFLPLFLSSVPVLLHFVSLYVLFQFSITFYFHPLFKKKRPEKRRGPGKSKILLNSQNEGQKPYEKAKENKRKKNIGATNMTKLYILKHSEKTTFKIC